VRECRRRDPCADRVPGRGVGRGRGGHR
jgi:hypothetical protein